MHDEEEWHICTRIDCCDGGCSPFVRQRDVVGC
jgi:hypothetical protein